MARRHSRQIANGILQTRQNHVFGAGAGAFSTGGVAGAAGAVAAGAVALQPVVQPVVQAGAALQQVRGALQQRVRAGLQQRVRAGLQQQRASTVPPALNTTATAAAAAKPNMRFILTSLKT